MGHGPSQKLSHRGPTCILTSSKANSGTMDSVTPVTESKRAVQESKRADRDQHQPSDLPIHSVASGSNLNSHRVSNLRGRSDVVKRRVTVGHDPPMRNPVINDLTVELCHLLQIQNARFRTIFTKFVHGICTSASVRWCFIKN